jgi:branched-chain amino acid transport system permease protein
MDQFLITLIGGISDGAIYGLVGLGLVIIFRSTDVMNFAIAAMTLMAAYIALELNNHGLALGVALLAGVAIASLLGIGVREALIRPLGEGRLFAALVVTMGVSIIAENLAINVWGAQPRSFPELVSGTVKIGSWRLQDQRLLAIVVACVAMAAVAYLFTRTPLGAAMRAVAESMATARVLGINAQKIARIAWGLGLGLASVGVLLYAPQVGLAPTAMEVVLFRAFAGIFLGGLTSMTGAVVGGLIIGVLDNVGALYVSASFRDTFVFAIAVLVLLIRPQGLFGRPVFQRV